MDASQRFQVRANIHMRLEAFLSPTAPITTSSVPIPVDERGCLRQCGSMTGSRQSSMSRQLTAIVVDDGTAEPQSAMV